MTSDHCEQSRRPIVWVSWDKLAAIFRGSDDLLVIDLHAGEAQFLAIPFTRTLRLDPNELTEVLKWLPPTRTAALCGASSLTAFMIQTSPFLRGTAPLYLLGEEGTMREAA